MRNPADPTGTSCPTPARARRHGVRRFALRSAVVIGGLGVAWWLTAGVAQAADGPADLRTTVRTATSQTPQAPGRVASTAKDVVRQVAAVRRTTEPVRRATEPIRRPAREITRVVRTTSTPVVEVATRVVRKVRDTAQPTEPEPPSDVNDPVRVDPSEAAPAAGTTPREPARAEPSAARHRLPVAEMASTAASAAPAAAAPSSLLGATPAAAAAPAVTAVTAGSPGGPSSPTDPCVGPGGSATGSASAWATAASPGVARPSPGSARPVCLLTVPVGAPSHPPGSSPD